MIMLNTKMSSEGEKFEPSEEDFDEDQDSISDEDDIVEELEKEDEGPTKRKLNNESEVAVKKKRLGTDLYKPPTVKELNQLRETTNLFHSNLFRLQIEEMLTEIKVKPKYQSLFQLWFDKFKTFVDQCKNSKTYDLSDKTWVRRMKVKVPFGQYPDGMKGPFHFVKPADISVAGSYRVGCCLGPKAKVDVKVQMPKECFQKGDHLNQKYDRKRALYLAFLAIRLQRSDLIESLSFSHVQGNPLKPVLELQLSGKLGKYISVALHPCVAPTVFKLARFAPSKSNIKASWLLRASPTEEGVDVPTPHYNNSVLQDLVAKVNEDILNEVLENRPNIRDGILLLKVWLHQRKLDQGHGCFGGFIMSMYVAYLLNSKLLNNSMSSYQVVRIVWSSLAQSDWTQAGITLASKTSEPSLEEFHQHFDVVFVDASGFCNLCADVSCETFHRVKQECEFAVKFLDSPHVNSFQALFMTPMDFQRQYDHIICLQDLASLEKVVEQRASHSMKLDYAGRFVPQALTLMLDVLRHGLGQRVALLSVQPPSPSCWPCNKSAPLIPKGPMLLGLTLNPEFAFNVLDKGPPANLPKAEKFREFWGSKSELRRFQDGSISEAVLWSGNETIAEKRGVCQQVVQYILSSHLGLTPGSYIYVANQIECLISQSKVLPAVFKYGTGEEATLAVLNSFDSLAKQLRQLNDIPLDVSTVQGTSAVFRYCEVFPPVAASLWPKKHLAKSIGNCSVLNEGVIKNRAPSWVSPVEAVIQLGMSGKWPNDLEAIRRIRAAFNIKIAKCLTEQCNLPAQAYPDYVHVYKDGYVFRIRVAYQREIAILKQKVTPEGVTKFQDTDESLYLEEKIVHLPKITGALHGLHQQFTSYGPTCCLAKRWLNAQLLGAPHTPEMCTELLVAHLYLSPEPFQPPNQPQLGFLRFLHLVSNTDWTTTPIILNLNAEMTREDIVEIENRFHSARSGLPPLFLATPYDRMDSRCTKEAPTLQILIRLGMLATEALAVLERELLLSNHPDYMQIFRPPLEVYDAVIHLHPLQNSRCHEAVDIQSDKLAKQFLQVYKRHKGEKIPVVGFDPVQCFLKELRENYSSFALFFHDCYGGNVIGVLWKPTVLDEKDFKVSHVNCQRLKTDGSKMILNVDAVLEDFCILGSGLVRTIETKDNPMHTD